MGLFFRLFSTTALTAVLGAGARGTDWIVDSSGAGDFKTIGAAIVVANPGDRLLVQPGHYPAFQFSVGVDVIGVGAAPADVRIDRVDYHVSIPAQHYDTLLSNVQLGSDHPADAIALSGNELGPGSLHLDGVVIDGAVFLGAGEGFTLLVTNSAISNQPGEWFAGETMYLGGAGSFVEIRNSSVQAAAATVTRAPAAGVRLSAGTTARIVNTQITGGNGNEGSHPDGAPAVTRGLFPGAVELRIDGNSWITGGSGPIGEGGHGVDLDGLIEVGAASVQGGSGNPPGLDFAAAQPVPTPVDLHLDLQPVLANAQVPVYLSAGDTIRVHMTTPVERTFLVVSLELNPPAAALYLPLRLTFPTIWVAGNSFQAVIPPARFQQIEGLEVYFQGLTRPAGQPLLVSDVASVRVDLLP